MEWLAPFMPPENVEEGGDIFRKSDVADRAFALTDVRLFSITRERLEPLCFQNPAFGLYLIRLIVRRFEANHADTELESA